MEMILGYSVRKMFTNVHHKCNDLKMFTCQRQKYRSMEQNRKPRDKSMNLWSKEARIYNGKKTTSLTSGAGKTGQPPVKE